MVPSHGEHFGMSSYPPYLTHTQTNALLNELGFNAHDRECVLDLTPIIQSDIGPLYPLTPLESMLNRAYWLGQEDVVSELAVIQQAN